MQPRDVVSTHEVTVASRVALGEAGPRPPRPCAFSGFTFYLVAPGPIYWAISIIERLQDLQLPNEFTTNKFVGQLDRAHGTVPRAPRRGCAPRWRLGGPPPRNSSLNRFAMRAEQRGPGRAGSASRPYSLGTMLQRKPAQPPRVCAELKRRDRCSPGRAGSYGN